MSSSKFANNLTESEAPQEGLQEIKTETIDEPSENSSTAPQEHRYRINQAPIYSLPRPITPLPKIKTTPGGQNVYPIKLEDYEKNPADQFDKDAHTEMSTKKIIFDLVRLRGFMWEKINIETSDLEWRKLAMDLYSRTGTLITIEQARYVWKKGKDDLRKKMKKYVEDGLNDSMMETELLKWDLYDHIRFYRKTLEEYEQQLRRGQQELKIEKEKIKEMEDDDEDEVIFYGIVIKNGGAHGKGKRNEEAENNQQGEEHEGAEENQQEEEQEKGENNEEMEVDHEPEDGQGDEGDNIQSGEEYDNVEGRTSEKFDETEGHQEREREDEEGTEYVEVKKEEQEEVGKTRNENAHLTGASTPICSWGCSTQYCPMSASSSPFCSTPMPFLTPSPDRLPPPPSHVLEEIPAETPPEDQSAQFANEQYMKAVTNLALGCEPVVEPSPAPVPFNLLTNFFMNPNVPIQVKRICEGILTTIREQPEKRETVIVEVRKILSAYGVQRYDSVDDLFDFIGSQCPKDEKAEKIPTKRLINSFIVPMDFQWLHNANTIKQEVFESDVAPARPVTPLPRIIKRTSLEEWKNLLKTETNANATRDPGLKKVVLDLLKGRRHMWELNAKCDKSEWEKLGMDAYERTGKVATVEQLRLMLDSARKVLRLKMKTCILKQKKNRSQTEEALRKWEFYRHFQWYREMLVDFEEGLRRGEPMDEDDDIIFMGRYYGGLDAADVEEDEERDLNEAGPSGLENLSQTLNRVDDNEAQEVIHEEENQTIVRAMEEVSMDEQPTKYFPIFPQTTSSSTLKRMFNGNPIKQEIFDKAVNRSVTPLPEIVEDFSLREWRQMANVSINTTATSDAALKKVVLDLLKNRPRMWENGYRYKEKDWEELGVEVYNRTRQMVTVPQMRLMFGRAKDVLKRKLQTCIKDQGLNEAQTEISLCGWEFYRHFEYYRKTLVEFEEKLRFNRLMGVDDEYDDDILYDGICENNSFNAAENQERSSETSGPSDDPQQMECDVPIEENFYEEEYQDIAQELASIPIEGYHTEEILDPYSTQFQSTSNYHMFNMNIKQEVMEPVVTRPITPTPPIVDQISINEWKKRARSTKNQDATADSKLKKVVLDLLKDRPHMWKAGFKSEEKQWQELGVDVFNRTQKIVTVTQMRKMVNNTKQYLKKKLRICITKRKLNKNQTESSLWDWEFYRHFIYFHETLDKFEEDLRNNREPIDDDDDDVIFLCENDGTNEAENEESNSSSAEPSVPYFPLHIAPDQQDAYFGEQRRRSSEEVAEDVPDEENRQQAENLTPSNSTPQLSSSRKRPRVPEEEEVQNNEMTIAQKIAKEVERILMSNPEKERILADAVFATLKEIDVKSPTTVPELFNGLTDRRPIKQEVSINRGNIKQEPVNNAFLS